MKSNGRLTLLSWKGAWRLLAAVLVIAAGLAGCAGGVSQGDGGGISGTGIQTVATGTVTGFGSVIVGGVHYSAKPGATVQLEGVGAAESALQPGMVVVLRGQFDSTANTGSYDSVSYRADLKGPAVGINALTGTFAVFGQTVLADAATVFDGVTDLSALTNGSLVQVSGAADSQGRLHATRVFRVQGAVGAGDAVKIKGRVASVGAETFSIGSQAIAYDSGTVFDNLTAADLSATDTRLIEVTGTLSGATISATRIERVDSVAGALTGERVYLRGFVISGSSADFLLNTSNGTVSVAGTGASYKNGSAAALVAGSEVEVTGTLSAGVVQAAQIEFELDNNINLEGDIQSIDTAGKTLALNGVTVTITDQTLFKDSSAAQLRGLNLGSLAVGNHVRVGGNLDRSVTPARVLATKLERFAASATAVLQGPVSQIAPQLAVLGVPVTVSSGTQFRQGGAGVADLASFSALLTLNSTVIKAKGSFSAGTGQLAADELTIE